MNRPILKEWLDKKIITLTNHLKKNGADVNSEKALMYLDALRHGLLYFSEEEVIHVLSGGVDVLYCECLMRLEDKDGVILSTEEVLQELDKWKVMPQVAQYLAEFALMQAVDHTYSIGINIPPQMFMAKALRDKLDALLREYKKKGVEPARVFLEILETPSLNIEDYMQGMIDWMHDLNRRGYRIGLDDFGAVDSEHTLEHIRKLPISFLKLDGKGMVEKMLDDSFDEMEYTEVFDYCTSQDIDIIAEHVETPQQAIALVARYPMITHIQSRSVKSKDFQK